jgi:AraC-like DNA-binding protein
VTSFGAGNCPIVSQRANRGSGNTTDPREEQRTGVQKQLSTELAQGATISEVRARFGLSQRRRYNLFDRRMGLRPKLLSRIERFAAALDAMPDRQCWSDLAFAHGFADQAHFIREFQQLSGYLPSQHAMLAGETRHARPSADKIFNTDGAS